MSTLLASDLSGLEAGGADVDALWGSLDHRANTLNVGVPTAAGADVGVRNGVTPRWALAADFAVGSHGKTPLSAKDVENQMSGRKGSPRWFPEGNRRLACPCESERPMARAGRGRG